MLGSVFLLFYAYVIGAASLPIITVHPPIKRSEGTHTFSSVCYHEYLCQMNLKLMQLDGLKRRVALKYYQLNTGCCAEALLYEHYSFSQCKNIHKYASSETNTVSWIVMPFG